MFGILACVCAAVLFVAPGCSSDSDETLVPVVTATFSTPEARNQFAEGSNRFALDLYGRLREQEGNLVVSPVSVATALGMVLAGARGKTEQEIATVLHMADLSLEEAHRAAADLQNDLNGRGNERPFELSIANRIWIEDDQKLLDGFASLMTKHYDADIGRVDFIGRPDAAVKQINAWASAATRDKIPTALDRDHINDLTRLLLINAIYFKAKWTIPFKEDYTEPRDFFRTKQDKIQVTTMFGADRFEYTDADTLQILRLPYQGQRLAMMILLTDEIDGLAEIEAQLSGENLAKWTQFENRHVAVYLPKFTFTADLQLNDALAHLGMPSAFDPSRADFSGVDGNKASDTSLKEQLFLQHVIHRAVIEVDEEGTEAAATTAVSKTVTSAIEDPIQFRADHPFLFLIQDKETGAILFMGRVVDPSKS
jgi:serpin B